MWKMLNQDNAIEGVALTIRFGEPLSSMVSRKVQRELDVATTLEGFTDRHPMQHLKVELNSQNADVRQMLGPGMVYLQSSLERNEADSVVPTVSRQIELHPSQFVMQIRKYRAWEKEWPTTIKILRSSLAIVSTYVPFLSLRLEYLNRFVFEGVAGEESVDGLLIHSDFIPCHVFSAPDLWHAHTGRFDPVDEVSRLLTQVNADAQIITPPHPAAGRRTLALMLAVERQFNSPGIEIAPDKVEAEISSYFSCLHDDIHALFKKIIDSKFAADNKLPV